MFRLVTLSWLTCLLSLSANAGELMVDEFSFAPDAPEAGESVTFNATVVNPGTTARMGSLQFHRDGQPVPSIHELYLQPGDEVVVDHVESMARVLPQMDWVLVRESPLIDPERADDGMVVSATLPQPTVSRLPRVRVGEDTVVPAGSRIRIEMNLANATLAEPFTDADLVINGLGIRHWEPIRYFGGGHVGMSNIVFDGSFSESVSFDDVVMSLPAVRLMSAGDVEFVYQVRAAVGDEVRTLVRKQMTLARWQPPEVTSLSGPDLVIERLDVNPAQPIAGEEVTFTVVIKNRLGVRAGPTELLLTFDGEWLPILDLPVMGLNDEFRQEIKAELIEGDHEFAAIIDPDDLVSEASENNTRRLDLKVIAAPAQAPGEQSGSIRRSAR